MRITLPAAIGITLLAVSTSRAQPVAPQSPRPAYSPYLNLLYGGGSAAGTALSYYGLVLPQQQYLQDSANFQQQLAMTNQSIQALGSANNFVQPEILLPYTGHGVLFNNTLGYFNRFPSGAKSLSFGGASSYRAAPGMGGISPFGGAGGFGGAGLSGGGIRPGGGGGIIPTTMPLRGPSAPLLNNNLTAPGGGLPLR